MLFRSPPRRVQYGTQTTDEMAELWIQVTGTPAALDKLAEVCSARILQDIVDASEERLRADPTDAGAHVRLGSIKLSQGNKAEALTHLRAAVQADPSSDEAHYYMGLLLRQENQLAAARQEFQTAVRLNADSYKSYGNLGFIAEQQGHWAEAEKQFRRALEIYPREPLVRAALDELLQAKKAARSN